MVPTLSPAVSERAAETTEKNDSSGKTSGMSESQLSVTSLPRYEDVEKANTEVPKVTKNAVDTKSESSFEEIVLPSLISFFVHVIILIGCATKLYVDRNNKDFHCGSAGALVCWTFIIGIVARGIDNMLRELMYLRFAQVPPNNVSARKAKFIFRSFWAIPVTMTLVFLSNIQ